MTHLYRKKPVVVEAARLKEENAERVASWCGGTVETRQNTDPDQAGYALHRVVMVDTLEGTMRADPGDYVIKGVKGEFYPCKPDIFEATYDPAEETLK